MIGSLLWKEWREQRWIVVGVFAVYLALLIAARLIVVRGAERAGAAMAQESILVLAFLVPGFVAMGTITQERARRTEQMVRALPVSGTAIFFGRFAGGVPTLFLPLVAAQVACALMFHTDIWPALLPEMGLMLMLYVWSLALPGHACEARWRSALDEHRHAGSLRHHAGICGRKPGSRGAPFCRCIPAGGFRTQHHRHHGAR